MIPLNPSSACSPVDSHEMPGHAVGSLPNSQCLEKPNLSSRHAEIHRGPAGHTLISPNPAHSQSVSWDISRALLLWPPMSPNAAERIIS